MSQFQVVKVQPPKLGDGLVGLGAVREVLLV
jgi:hypothetical protein